MISSIGTSPPKKHLIIIDHKSDTKISSNCVTIHDLIKNHFKLTVFENINGK